MGTEVDDFLTATMPRLTEAEIALHDGDASPRIAMWSRNDPVTVFGAAALNGRGWAELGPLFERLGSSFSNCTSYENEVIAAGASGDLAYIVAFEHTTASVNGAPPQPYMLRVTTVFRREDGEWKVVHRHGDPLASKAAAALAERLSSAAGR
jgi:ketosteroid isomerase-like protein